MARKRGGLAGIYDRNKGLIQKAVPAALSFIPGAGIPLAAAAGAAMRGLDRPGKSGVGFDPFAALKGGVEGYTIGQGTQALAGGVKGLLTAGRGAAPMAASVAPSAAAPNFQVGFQGIGAPVDGIPGGGFGAAAKDLPSFGAKVGMTPGFGAAQAPIGTPSVSGVRDILQPVQKGASKLGKALGKAQSFTKENKDLIELAGKGILSQMSAPGEEAAMMNAETARMRYEEEQRQLKMEEERRQRIAQLLMPYAMQSFPQYFGGR